MSLGFLAPILLGGLALGIVPWLLHRLRRPDRNTVPFGSLMFVPPSKEVARPARKVEHPLLMALRIVMLLLLAAAFARPFLPAEADAAVDTSDTLHVIALDVSASMQRAGAFDAAKRHVDEILRGMGPNHRVALMAFGKTIAWPVPLDTSNEASANAVRAQLNELAPGNEAGANRPALRQAESALIAAAGDDPARPLVLHLVSDLQRAGLAETGEDWQLTQRVELRVWPCGTRVDSNTAILETTVSAVDDALRVRARIRQTPPGPDPVFVTLSHEGGEPMEKAATLAADGTATVEFRLDVTPDALAAGSVSIAEDGVSYDDWRYWSWNPLRPLPVRLVRESAGVLRFTGLALRLPGNTPFDVQDMSPSELGAAELAPGTVLVASPKSWTTDRWVALTALVEQGARALVILDGAPASEVTQAMAEWGVEAGAVQDAPMVQTISWADFDAPVFATFRGARWNDFSALRFEAWLPVQVRDESVRVLARFDPLDDAPSGPPAIIQLARGEGEIVLWCFGDDPETSNLAKSPRFVPLLHETVALLGGGAAESAAYAPGDALLDAAGSEQVRVPGADSFEAVSEPLALLEEAGHVVWRRGETDIWIEAANVDAAESSLESVQPEAVLSQLAALDTVAETEPGVAAQTPAHARRDAEDRNEFGWPMLFAAAAVLLLESALAVRVGG